MCISSTDVTGTPDLIFAGDIAGDDDAGAPEIHGELRHVEAGLARFWASHSTT